MIIIHCSVMFKHRNTSLFRAGQGVGYIEKWGKIWFLNKMHNIWMKTLTVSKCPQITSWVFRAHSSKILAIVGRQPFLTYNLYRICEELLKWVKKFGDQNHTFFIVITYQKHVSSLQIIYYFSKTFFCPNTSSPKCFPTCIWHWWHVTPKVYL